MQGAIRPHALHVQCMGIADPEVVGGNALVFAAYVGAALVVVGFFALSAQHRHRIGYRLGFAVKGVIAGQRQGRGHIFPRPLLGQRHTAGDRQLRLIQEQAQKFLLDLRQQHGLALAGLAALIHQGIQVSLADRRPLAVQRFHANLALRLFQLTKQHELLIALGLFLSGLAAVFLPLFH